MENINFVLPEHLENINLPAPELLTFYQNRDQRIIWLDDEVADYCLEYGRMIIAWNMEDKNTPINDRHPIRLMIMSPGGSLEINNALIDIIKLSKTPVYGYNVGMAASAACFIFMSCHKRFAMPQSTFLLHKGSSQMGGTYDQVAAEMDEYERQIGELASFILSHSKINEETLVKYLSGEWYVTAKQAHDDYGFVDEIITDIDQLY